MQYGFPNNGVSIVKISTRICSPIAIDEGHEQLEQQHLEGKEGGIVLTDDPESQIKLPPYRPILTYTSW